MKRLYSEGDVFLVPLKSGGYARGLIARTSPKGKGIYGYFFGPRLENVQGVVLEDIQPSKSILRLMFGDLGFIKKEWPIIGKVKNWNRTLWPMPDFIRRNPIDKTAVLVRYCDTDTMKIESELTANYDTDLPIESASGYVAVQIKLEKLLGGKTGQVLT